MSKLKITEGKNFTVRTSGLKDPRDSWHDIIVNPVYVWGKCVADSKSASLIDGTIEESEANAELIADAFNTANETQLLPSELKEQRDELIRVLQDFISSAEVIDDEHFSMEIDQAKELINKIKDNE